MTFVDSIRTCFRKYADFTGCASVSEFWWWVLFTFIGGMVTEVVSHRLSVVFSLLTLVPGIAAGARRLHDTNRSGWLQLLFLIPLIGWIILIVLWVQDGKVPNRYCPETQDLAP